MGVLKSIYAASTKIQGFGSNGYLRKLNIVRDQINREFSSNPMRNSKGGLEKSIYVVSTNTSRF